MKPPSDVQETGNTDRGLVKKFTLPTTTALANIVMVAFFDSQDDIITSSNVRDHILEVRRQHRQELSEQRDGSV